jgi:serine/threonine-protein kinase
MGEVYRADDLKLGQPVALKFLPRALASDPVRRERFFAEVRITRQLAHPNICRVYDIADVDGQHFLSMEYIDGEDLASLIKRIGYLSNEKALDIARQLAAGLAAAHEKGVLHRDLKPSNIMIDGHGRVRITDFGLAIAASEEETEAAEILGTPAYMAPEQFAGKGATTRSDIYALGLIFYEIATGKRAFTGGTLAELREQKEHTPKAPSEMRQGIDPVVERVILRCIDRDPRSRPASVGQVALALPGGDPLAAALAAGETPSPELVAASGLKEGLRPTVALGILAFVIAGIILGMALSSRQDLYKLTPFDKPPDALVDQSRQFLRKIGYTDGFTDSAWGFTVDHAYLQYLRDHDKSPNRWPRGGAGAIQFWYRQSPNPLVPWSFDADVRSTDPPAEVAGEIALTLDTEGRLTSFMAVPNQTGLASNISPPDWTVLFSESGLDPSKWAPTEPERDPLFHADTLVAWKGSVENQPDIPLRIEAASRRGKVVSFLLTGPWTQPARLPEVPPTVGQQISDGMVIVFLLALIGGAAFFARRNLRLGRGDRKGAMRVVTVSASLLTASWIFGVHHVAAVGEAYLFIQMLALTLLVSGAFWLLYIALEPFVRRKSPQVLVSWTRVLAGDWRDPQVGRDVLLGTMFGAAMVCLLRSVVLLAAWFTGRQLFAFFGVPAGVLGAGDFIGTVVGRLAVSTGITLGFLCLIFFFKINRVIGAGLILLFVAGDMAGNVYNVGLGFFLAVLFAGVPLFVLLRFGLVCAIVTVFVYQILVSSPITFQTSAWYSSAGFASLILVAAITAYGFRTALGDRRILEDLAPEE